MPRLYKTSNSGAELIIDHLMVSDNYWLRLKGLLGTKSLNEKSALWLKPCNNIHTFFMNFSIDCIFVDQKMQIKGIVKNVKPYRFAGPYWKAYSVIETQAGFADAKKLEIGDHLYVVD